MTQWRWGVGVFVIGLLASGTVQAASMDPLEVGPHIYTKKFENERVRVMEIAFKPGDTIDMHSHPDHVTYLLTDGTLTLSYPDGTSKTLARGKSGRSVLDFRGESRGRKYRHHGRSGSGV